MLPYSYCHAKRCFDLSGGRVSFKKIYMTSCCAKMLHNRILSLLRRDFHAPKLTKNVYTKWSNVYRSLKTLNPVHNKTSISMVNNAHAVIAFITLLGVSKIFIVCLKLVISRFLGCICLAVYLLW